MILCLGNIGCGSAARCKEVALCDSGLGSSRSFWFLCSRDNNNTTGALQITTRINQPSWQVTPKSPPTPTFPSAPSSWSNLPPSFKTLRGTVVRQCPPLPIPRPFCPAQLVDRDAQSNDLAGEVSEDIPVG